MTRDDVKGLFKRIKSNYPTFIVDDYKLTEWFKELEDYNIEEINKKLEEHMRSENFGQYEPKVYFLTKYLIKEKDKKNSDGIMISCTFCNKLVKLNEYDNHYHKCSSIDYINRQSKKYFGKEIDKDKYYNMSDIELDERYTKLITYIKDKTTNKNEKKILDKILHGGTFNCMDEIL